MTGYSVENIMARPMCGFTSRANGLSIKQDHAGWVIQLDFGLGGLPFDFHNHWGGMGKRCVQPLAGLDATPIENESGAPLHFC